MGLDVAKIQNVTLKSIAEDIDSNNVKDGALDKDEITIFEQKVNEKMNELENANQDKILGIPFAYRKNEKPFNSFLAVGSGAGLAACILGVLDKFGKLPGLKSKPLTAIGLVLGAAIVYPLAERMNQGVEKMNAAQQELENLKRDYEAVKKEIQAA